MLFFLGPRDKDETMWLKKRMAIIWREKYQPAVDREVAEFAAAHPDATEDDKQKKQVRVRWCGCARAVVCVRTLADSTHVRALRRS